MRKYLNLFLCSILLALAFQPFTRLVRAQSGGASELIAAVNAYRSANGLAPYDVDVSLMSEAQSHSEYQASIQTCTHQRADGTTAGDHGISAENVACGIDLTVDAAINFQWADSLHSATILGPDTGQVGAGVAFSGSSVYYTLAVRRLSGDFTYRQPLQTTGQQEAPDPQVESSPSGPFMTSTPNEDGSIAHVIRFGETLVQIAEAYGITLNDLYNNNASLDPQNPEYFEGQVLFIRLANTATPEISPTITPLPPTRTPAPTRTPTTVQSRTSTHTVSQTPEGTTTPGTDPEGRERSEQNRRILGYGVIIVCAAGLVFVVIKGFLTNKPS